MTRAELIKDMKSATGSSFITVTELCKYLGLSNNTRVKAEYLADLDRVGTHYFIPDVAGAILERRKA